MSANAWPPRTFSDRFILISSVICISPRRLLNGNGNASNNKSHKRNAYDKFQGQTHTLFTSRLYNPTLKLPGGVVSSAQSRNVMPHAELP